MSPFGARKVSFLWPVALLACVAGLGAPNADDFAWQAAYDRQAARYQEMQRSYTQSIADQVAQRERMQKWEADLSRQGEIDRWKYEAQRSQRLEAQRQAKLRAEQEAIRAEAERARYEAWIKYLKQSPEVTFAALDRAGLTFKYADFIEALRYWSDQGNAEAAYRIATMLRGYKDSRERIEYLMLAADRGHPFAKVELGDAYRKGNGVTRDSQHAYQLYREAIKGGAAGGYGGLANVLLEWGRVSESAEANALAMQEAVMPLAAARGSDMSASNHVGNMTLEQKIDALARCGEALIAGRAPFPKDPVAGFIDLFYANQLSRVPNRIGVGYSVGKWEARLDELKAELDPDALAGACWTLYQQFGPDRSKSMPVVLRFSFNKDFSFRDVSRIAGELAVRYGSLDAQLALAAEAEKQGGEFLGDAWFYYCLAIVSPGRDSAEPNAMAGLKRIAPYLTPAQRTRIAFRVGRFFDSEFMGGGRAPILAELWQRLAADEGSADAMYRLSVMTREVDPTQSALWKRKAAIAGSFDALVLEGDLKEYARESGDFLSLVAWLSYYADQGHDQAMLRLADIYESRGRSPDDLICAYRWLEFLKWRIDEEVRFYDRADYDSTRSTKIAKEGLPAIESRCSALGNRLTPAQRAKAFEGLGRWFEDRLEAHRSEPLGNLWQSQDQSESLSEIAAHWYQLSADLGSAEGMFHLGKIEWRNSQKVVALELFRKAAAMGHSGAAEAIGRAYEKGDPVPRNIAEAQAWLWISTPGEIVHSELSPDELAHARKRFIEICESGREFPRHLDRAYAMLSAIAATDESDVLSALRRDALVADLSTIDRAQALATCAGFFGFSGGYGFGHDKRLETAFIECAAFNGDARNEARYGYDFVLLLPAGADITQKQYDSAVFWLQRSISHGYGLACIQLALCIKLVEEQNARVPEAGRIKHPPGLTAASQDALWAKAAELGYFAGVQNEVDRANRNPVGEEQTAIIREHYRRGARLDPDGLGARLAEDYNKGTPLIPADALRAYLWSLESHASEESLRAIIDRVTFVSGEEFARALLASGRELDIAGIQYLD